MRILQQIKGHIGAATYKKTKSTTPKMSTSSSSSNKRQKSYSLSRTTLLTAALLACSLLNLQILQIQGMSPDYGDTEELQLNSGSNSEVVSKNDEIYDTAQLQQEIEDEEKQHDMAQSFEGGTEIETTPPPRNMSTNQISAEEYSQEKVELNTTRRRHTASLSDSLEEMSDEYNDSEHISEGSAAAKTKTTLPPTTASTTAMIPEYVARKSKAIGKKSADDHNISDYEADDGDDVRMSSQESENRRRLLIQHQADLPLARKFYQAEDAENNDHQAEDDEDIGIAGKANDLLNHHPLIPIPQPQFQLPEQHLDQNFRNQSDEEYYDDSRDASYEQLLAKQNLLTTTAPATSTTTSTPTSTTSTTTTTTTTETPVFSSK